MPVCTRGAQWAVLQAASLLPLDLGNCLSLAESHSHSTLSHSTGSLGNVVFYFADQEDTREKRSGCWEVNIYNTHNISPFLCVLRGLCPQHWPSTCPAVWDELEVLVPVSLYPTHLLSPASRTVPTTYSKRTS